MTTLRSTCVLLMVTAAAFAIQTVGAGGEPPAPVTIATEKLEVTCQPGGAFSVRLPGSQTPLVSGQLTAASGEAKVAARKDATFGQGQAIEFAGPQGLQCEVLMFADLPFVLFRSRLHNDGEEPKTVASTALLQGRIDLGTPSESLKILGTGGLKSPADKSGSYMWMAVAEPKTRRGLVGGWITTDRGSGAVLSGVEQDRPTIEARIDYGRLRIAPGQFVPSETFALGYFDDARLGLEAYADAVAKVYRIKLPPQPCGYCTWYHAGASNEKSLPADSAFAAEKLAPYGFSVMQIDDGWQEGEKKNGPRKNFTAPRARGPYPSGMKAAAESVKSKGLVPGLWFMPFAGTHDDPWFAEHQDWFVKRADGSPYDTAWGGTCLDMTHPGAREYLRSIVTRIADDWGYRYFKMDGLYTGTGTKQIYVNDVYRDDGMGDAVFHNPEKTNIEAYRDGLRLVREAAGSEVFLLGCCAPQNMRSYGGAFGLVDAMRIGSDNGANWKGLMVGPKFGSRNYFLHGRVWHNDPDPVYVRASLPVEQARLSCSWAAISGQLTVASDDFSKLPPDRLDILRRIMPAHGALARPVDLFESAIPQIWLVSDTRRGPRRDCIGLFNWESRPIIIECPLERIGLPEKRYAAFDFWGDRLLPTLDRRLNVEVPGQSCMILAVRPVAEHPQILSTSRHVTQGIVDVLEERWNDATKELSGTSQVGGGEDYELRIATGSDGAAWRIESIVVLPEDLAAGVKIQVVDQPQQANAKAPPLARITIHAPESRPVRWKIRMAALTRPQ